MDKWRFPPIVLVLGWAVWLLVLGAAAGWYAGVRIFELAHFALLLLHQMGLLFLVVLGAFGYGVQIIKAVKITTSTGIYYLFSIALGLGVLAHLTYVLGMLGLLYELAAWLVILVGTVLALVDFYGYRQVFWRIARFSRFSWFSLFMFVMLVLNVIYPLLNGALSPPVWWDEAAYHLAVPKIYINHRSIVYIPFIPYSNWPMEGEMLFTLGLLLRSETLSHLIEWVSVLLTCWGLYLLGKKILSSSVGLLAGVLFLSTPMVTTLAGTALIEPTLTLFTFLAVFCFLEWTETRQRRLLVLSALFGGLAASTKLNGALVPLILGLLTAVVTMTRSSSNHQWKQGIQYFVFYGLISFAVVMPWYLKSWIHTGNPFWPFLLEVFGGKNWDALGNEYLLGFIRKPNLPLTLINWLLGFWRLSTRPLLFGPLQFSVGMHYLIGLPLAIPALLWGPNSLRNHLRTLSIVTLLFYTAWFLQTHQSRFLMPTTPLLALLSAVGIEWLISLYKEQFELLIRSGIALFLVCTSWLATPEGRAQVNTHWLFLSGQLTREEFLSREVPGYAAFAYANKILPNDAYVLLALYESRGYYLDRNYMWANPISQRALRFEEFKNATDLANALRARGFTHILFRPVGLERYSYIRYGEYITNLIRSLLVQECRLIYSTPELEIYELVRRVSAK
jgi:4-amino-4-deoxy-L-arabinose transferase-like glycosyltransferase